MTGETSFTYDYVESTFEALSWVQLPLQDLLAQVVDTTFQMPKKWKHGSRFGSMYI